MPCCRQSKKLAEAEEAVLAKRELDNIIADLRRQLADAQAEVATLQVHIPAVLVRRSSRSRKLRLVVCAWWSSCAAVMLLLPGFTNVPVPPHGYSRLREG